jgi:hypothetical protein
MIDPATGAPTREEAAAAREELKQRRHESTQSGKGPDHNEAYTAKITIRAAGRTPVVPGIPAAGRTKTGAAADVKRTDTI